jgi:hypothetical protein
MKRSHVAGTDTQKNLLLTYLQQYGALALSNADARDNTHVATHRRAHTVKAL